MFLTWVLRAKIAFFPDMKKQPVKTLMRITNCFTYVIFWCIMSYIVIGGDVLFIEINNIFKNSEKQNFFGRFKLQISIFGDDEMIDKIVNDIGDFIFVENKVEKADAIMVVGGSHPELGEKAAELWKRQYAPVILISGGVSIKTGKFPGPRSKSEIYNKQYETEYDFFTDVLLKSGVPQSAFYGENKSSYTKENALFAREVVSRNKLSISKAILICKAFHARRSLMFYQLAFPNVNFLVSPVFGYDITKDNWYKTDYGIQRVMGELSRCGNQFVDDFINDKASLISADFE